MNVISQLSSTPESDIENVALSIVIATFNRRALLERALAGLEQQTVGPESFEVIVVDDGSTDTTTQWMSEQRFSFNLKTLSQENQGPSVARNAGVELATGDVVLFLDDDLIAEPELVAEHMKLHAQHPSRTVVLGPASSLPHYSQPWVAWQQGTMEKAYERMSQGGMTPTFRHFWSGNCSVPRLEFMAAGGYNTAFLVNEDVELGYRLMELGLNFVFNPAACGYHHSARSFQGWANAHATYGRTNVEILRRSGSPEMYRELRADWQSRHILTRLLARLTMKGSFYFQMTVKPLSALVQLGRLAPMSKFSRLSCAALANALYWNEVSCALGDNWHWISGPIPYQNDKSV